MIDWDRVDGLRAEIGAEDFAEVVAMFLEEADEVAERLSRQSDDALRADLHFLKGAALNLGFSALADLCGQGEGIRATGFDPTPVVTLYYTTKAAFSAALETV